jgi:uncharacterized protein YbjT (DUF2867 family)
MNVIVFGATGGTGRQVVAQALSAGHTVTGVARRPTYSPSGTTGSQRSAGMRWSPPRSRSRSLGRTR